MAKFQLGMKAKLPSPMDTPKRRPYDKVELDTANYFADQSQAEQDNLDIPIGGIPYNPNLEEMKRRGGMITPGETYPKFRGRKRTYDANVEMMRDEERRVAESKNKESENLAKDDEKSLESHLKALQSICNQQQKQIKQLIGLANVFMKAVSRDEYENVMSQQGLSGFTGFDKPDRDTLETYRAENPTVPVRSPSGVPVGRAARQAEMREQHDRENRRARKQAKKRKQSREGYGSGQSED